MNVPQASAELTIEKALIWRVVHRDNVPWILDHGARCASSATLDPNFVQIGKPDLIENRNSRLVPVPPNGTLADYVPFYFTPFSPMVYNIITGRGVRKRDRGELCFLVTSLRHVSNRGHPFVFADRHAYLRAAEFFTDLADLRHVDWPRLQARDFKRDPDDPLRFERYEAEALIHDHLPVASLQGIVCYDEQARECLATQIADRQLAIKAVTRPKWYF